MMVVVVTRRWWEVALRGVAALAFGLLTLVWPDLTLWALVVLFGAYALVDGICTLAVVGTGAVPRDGRVPLVFRGLAGVVAGVVALVWPSITALALLFTIAAWAIVSGVLEIAAAIRLRRQHRHGWLVALEGVLSVVFGILLAITPGDGALVITWLIGWFAIAAGATLLVVAWRLRSLVAGDGRRRSGRTAAAARRRPAATGAR